MMDFDQIVVKESPGLCRCCLSEGCYKDLGTEYPWMSDTEVYADMLLECFDISITQHNDGPNGPNRLICEVCITRLRDACNFKKQVMDSEKKFIDMVGRGEFRPKVLIYQEHMKLEEQAEESADEPEVEYLEEEMTFGDDDIAKEEAGESSTYEDITVSALPVKGKRGRPKKNVVKTETKAKVPKMEDKPRTSKAVAKDFHHTDTLIDEKLQDKQRKNDLIKLLRIVIENSTIMPFKWSSNGYMCFYCGCPFVDCTSLRAHTKDEHSDANLTNVLKLSTRNSNTKLDISEVSCKRCPKKFLDLKHFLTHAADDHDLKFNRDAAQSIFSFKLSDDSLSCHHCGQTFKFFGPLLIHVNKYHRTTNPYLCDTCGQGFIARANLNSHIKTVHFPARGECDKCHRTFSNSVALKRHYEDEHKVSLQCPKCPESFSTPYLRKRHLALVHDVKRLQFNCDECPRIFTDKSRLIYHKSRVHLKEKTIACEVCGFKVFDKYLLGKHMVSHSDARPFQCDVCKKCFQRSKTLEYHRRIHSNDRRHACKECGKAFVQVASLKLHLRVHHSSGKE